MLYKIVLLGVGDKILITVIFFPVKIRPLVRELHHIMIKFGFICVSVLSKDIWCHV